MTVIESNQGVITQINVFDVEPDKVDLLVATLKDAARTVTHIRGWMSINIHVSLDRTKVTNYRLVAIAQPHPCLYDVVWTLDQSEVASSR
jgi:hypothetical protein